MFPIKLTHPSIHKFSSNPFTGLFTRKSGRSLSHGGWNFKCKQYVYLFLLRFMGWILCTNRGRYLLFMFVSFTKFAFNRSDFFLIIIIAIVIVVFLHHNIFHCFSFSTFYFSFAQTTHLFLLIFLSSVSSSFLFLFSFS